ncbi:MAG: tRNA-dihydrouridine synthase [Candidatus Komeilibacteria bacterium]
MRNCWQKLNKPILALAPMAGITDSSFRLICKKYGADIVYTEMVSAAGLCHGSQKTLNYLKFNKKEQPVILQLFGSKPEQFAKAAQIVEQAGFAGIDINFGCPAKKVIQNESGATLMNNLDRAYDIIEATCNATSLPISIKMRNSKGTTTAYDFVSKTKDLPIAAIMIHGRSFEQDFSGDANWDQIKKVRKIYQGILLANGGIYSPQTAKQVISKLDIDGLGLAQGIQGKPWLFQQIKDYLKKDKYNELSWSQIKKIILEHAKLAMQDKDNLIEMRKHLLWYVKNQPNAKELRQELVKIESLEDIENILNSN